MQQLTAAHGELTAVRSGAGPDIVVFHSLLADRSAFDPVLPALAARHRVTLVNLPGYGGSQNVMPLLDAYLARLEDGFEEFGIGPDAVLIGHGFGGMLALGFALAHPDRMAKLILCSAIACLPEASKQIYREMAETVATDGVGGVAERAVRRLYGTAYLQNHPEAVAERRTALASVDAEAFRAACTIMIDTDLMPLLPKLKLPTLLVCGAEDVATPPALSQQIGQKLANGRYIELPGCGHCPPVEAPKALTAAIGTFVDL